MNRIVNVAKLMIMVFFTLSLVACIKDPEDPKNPTDEREENGERPDIEGKWKTDCAYDQEDDIGINFKLTFTGTDFSLGLNQYSDNSCTQLIETETLTGTFTYKQELPSSSGIIPHEIDLKIKNGKRLESLIARQDDTLYVSFNFEGTGRPNKMSDAIPFSIDSEETPKRLDIDGKWNGSCVYFEDEEIGITSTYEFSGDKFTLILKGYSDDSCSQFQAKATHPGTITLGKELTTPSGITAHEIDLHFEDGDEWVSLAARQGNTLYLTPSLNSKRPNDIDTDLAYSKQ